MRFGIKTPPQHCSWQEMLAIWQAADEIEIYESAWNFDHFYPLTGDSNGPCMEAWVTLAALAAKTKRIRIGCMVSGTPYRHPAVIANMAATLDIVSGGRLELGLGAGWHEVESAAYGIELLPMKQRMDRFEEAVQVVRSLLTQEETNFEGEYFNLADARCEPKGPQQPLPPIVIGGGGEKRTMRIAARYADHWNLPFPTPEQLRAKLEIMDAHCEAVGRDRSEITCSVQIPLATDQNLDEAAANAAELEEAGADMVIFSMRSPYDVSIVESLAKELQTFLD